MLSDHLMMITEDIDMMERMIKVAKDCHKKADELLSLIDQLNAQGREALELAEKIRIRVNEGLRFINAHQSPSGQPNLEHDATVSEEGETKLH